MLNIIHLSHREDRLKLINNQLITQNITNYRFWEGIVDSENAAKGIAKAHKQIVLWARQENLRSVMIAEDDVKFTAKGAESQTNYFLRSRPWMA